VQLLVFSLEVKAEGLPLSPGCVLFTGPLTFNGEAAADSVSALVIPLVGDVDTIRLAATGPGYASLGMAVPGQILGLEKPASGDYTFSADCLFGEEVVATTSRVITINRDAGSKEAGE
jgi:hypothetical protein